MSELAVIQPQPRQVIQVIDPIPVLDTGRFEQMQRIAKVMASTSMCPEALRAIRDGDRLVDLPFETVMANCFMVVNQAVRWGMDPFAVAQSVSIVRGKLCYEGKLVAAVLDAKLGVRLFYEWDDKTGDAAGIVVSGTLPGEAAPRFISGTVGDWKTTGKGSPWTTPLSCRRQLSYRGSREWARIHSPAIMLGVYTADEMEALQSERHSSQARSDLPPSDVSPSSTRKLPGPPPPPVGAAATAHASDAPGTKKAPPGPPPPAQTPTLAQPTAPIFAPGDFDFEAFHNALRVATSSDQANEIYEQWIVPNQGNMTSEEIEEADAIIREACAPFGAEE